MEVKDLYGFTLLLVLVGMVLGVGVLVLDKFSLSVDQVAVNNESFIVPNQTETASLTGSNIVSFTKVVNAAGTAWNTGNYTVDLVAGSITVNDNRTTCTTASTCFAYYTWARTTGASSVAIGQARDVVGDIPELWLPLIVTIAVLAIILVLVIRSFGGAANTR